MQDESITPKVTMRYAGPAEGEGAVATVAAPTLSLPAAAPAAADDDAEAAKKPKIPTGKTSDGRTWIVDSLDRRLVLRELDIIEEQELIGMVGEPLCLNRLYMQRIYAVCRVAEINGERVDVPLTMREAKVVMKRVGNAGLIAVNIFERDEEQATLDQAKK